MSTETMIYLLSAAAVVLELLGLAAAFNAIMKGRTSQGTVAWALSLVFVPLIALPLYLVFGSHKFHGRVNARRSESIGIHAVARTLVERLQPHRFPLGEENGAARAAECLAELPLTRGNTARLLVDGEATFQAIFEGIDSARDYVLVQFFIIYDDGLGRALKKRLVDKARDGVRVYLLYDEIGSHKLPGSYLSELERAGVHVSGFRTTKGTANRFQLNFRNHRKIVVVDGERAWVGGLNVGDNYLGRSARFGPWRDTHVEVRGPSVQCVQLSFLEDWYWATHTVPTLDWEPKPAATPGLGVLALASGPGDELETCGLFFTHAINTARERIWITSPYFVPDAKVIGALQLAALRGVDVRIMLPAKADHVLVYLSSFSYYEETKQTGVKIYRYQPGFMHHKVMLVDDAVSAIGTANLDNRSFRINFEITMLFVDPDFTAQVREMLERDFANCRLAHLSDYTNRPFWFKLAVRVARLLAPVQ